MLAEQFDAFLLDLDGVVHVDGEPTPGAVEAVNRLREERHVRFLTNNSRSTRDTIARELRELGIDADPDDVVASTWATGAYLRESDVDTAFVVGTDGLRTEVERAGVDPAREDADAVVVGLDPGATYADIETAARALENGADLVATNVDGAYPTAGGISPGTGSLVNAIRTVVDREPVVIGKPEPHMFERAMAGFPDGADVAMLGDNPEADIAGANAVGIHGVLVTVRDTFEPPFDGESAPDATIPDLRALYED